MKYDKKLPTKGKVTMKEFEGSKVDKRADAKAVKQINKERSKSKKK
jgi:hypothetical protein